MDRLRGLVAGLADEIDRRRWWVAAGLVGAGLAGAWWLVLSSGSLTGVSHPWFFVPVVFAAVRIGPTGALITGTVAALLGGPAVFTVEGAASAYGVWATRGTFYLGVGVFVAGLVAVVIGVRDEGLGIDVGFLEEAFQPFAQADPSSQRVHGGLGIGLFAARRIVERLGGSTRIDPVDGDVGTSVVIVVPQQRDGDPAGRLRRRTGGPSWMLGHTRAGPATSVALPDTAG